MIYLLRSPGVDTSGNFCWLLKIGWTEDNEATRRFATYRSHNPSVKVLCTFPGLSKNVEEALHEKFSLYRFPGFIEWYIYCAEIIDYFVRPEVYQELKSLSPTIRREEIEWEKRKRLLRYISYIVDESFPLLEANNEEDFVRKMKIELGEEKWIRVLELIEEFKTIPKEAQQIITDLSKYKTIISQVKYLRSLRVDDAILELIFNSWLPLNIESEYLKYRNYD